jgi:hypothetical protein
MYETDEGKEEKGRTMTVGRTYEGNAGERR